MPKSIEERVRDIIVDELGVEADEVTPAARLVDDLGADSLDCVELVMRFEEEFNVEIPDDECDKVCLGTVREAVDYVTAKVG